MVICLSVVFEHYTLQMYLISLPFQIAEYMAILAISFDGVVAATLILTITYYEHLRINKINRTIERVNRNDSFEVHVAVIKFFEEHFRYCDHLLIINKFGKNLSIVFFVTSFPFNLIMMHQVLFEDLSINLRIAYGLMLFGDDAIMFGVQYSFASLSLKCHKMCSKLSRLQWSINRYPNRMRTKLKLLMCFERLSSKRKIGITLGSMVFTMPLFSKVIILIDCHFTFSIYFSIDSSKILSLFHSHT